MKVPDGPKKHLHAQPRFRRDKDKISVNLGVKVCYEIMLNEEIFLILYILIIVYTIIICISVVSKSTNIRYDKPPHVLWQ